MFDHKDKCSSNRKCPVCRSIGAVQDEDGQVCGCLECHGDGHRPCDCEPETTLEAAP